MNLKKKILIVGPISDFGGREIEAKNIVDALTKDFRVDLLSTIPMTKKSVALLGDNVNRWSTIDKKIFNSNIFIQLTSIACKLIYRRKEPAYRFIGNKLNSKCFSFDERYFSTLKKEIARYDTIIFSCELTTKWLEEVIVLCQELNRPLIVRTTGTITIIPKAIVKLLKNANAILVHSNSNYEKLIGVSKKNIKIIDQTTLLEEDLINIKINEVTNGLIYGYLGRFSKEKGIVELLKTFENLNKKLIVAGSGPLQNEVIRLTKNNKFIDCLGELSSEQIIDFFNRIDVLIIPSFEEAGPLVGIEAMAAGKIIISTQVGAMMDRLDKTDNQFWFNIEEGASLVNTIFEIENLNEKILANIRHELRTVYKNKYSRKTIGKNYLDAVRNASL
ncbi:glycosyltransferase family 4 protein [Flavivirga jejuensis]|uniref:Glycosyltransferase family 4 protein n=1 Tax=Flavivirga jejuensis TaxID=870487 RepID=A0ABT8WU27_9FLAO|nr:glycosyltransferase family 4 protein [Flavivirga jejuensis]MDO5976665.1 glycosyltransferase family 4 protein [Flavivirga jejuensis]